MKLIGYILLLLPCFLLALDAEKNFNDYLLRRWDSSSGLPNNTINCIIQSHSGHIWIGTPAGLVRFDGVQFKIFTRWNTPILINDKIRCLFEDKNQTLWIGTAGGGLFSHNQGVWKEYNKKNGLSNDHITAIKSDLNENLWIGTEYGLNRLDSRGITIFTTHNGLYDNIILSLDVDPWGNVWVGSLRGGLAQWIEGTFRIYDIDDGLKNIFVKALYSDQRGNTWIGTLEGLFFLRQGENIIQNIPGTSYTPITAITKGPKNSLWIGTMVDGIKRILHDKMDGYSSENSFPDDFIRCLLTDRDGNIWVGTEMAGLIQIKDRRIQNLAGVKGPVTAVLQDSRGTFWIGSRNNGLLYKTNDKVDKYFDKDSELANERINVLYKDNLGRLWIGTESKGIVLIDKKTRAYLSKENGLSSNHITAIQQDRSGTVWIGTDLGLNGYSEQITNKIFQNDAYKDIYIRVIYQNKDGEIYTGTKFGIFTDPGIITDSLKYLNPTEYFDVAVIYEDSHGMLWIGTNGNGLKRFFKGEIRSCTTEEGLPDNYIFSITEDENGFIWMSSYKGIFKVIRNELNEFFEHKTNYIFPTLYDENEGMISSQCTGNVQPAFIKANTGLLYYPTAKGISFFNPESIQTKNESVQLVIEDIRANDRPYNNNKRIIFPPGVEQIEISFSAIAFNVPEKIYFKYKLEGFDTNYIYLKQKDDRTAVYKNLDPGEYTFIVNASANNAIWNAHPVTVQFEILPPVYAKPFFYIFVFICLIITGGAYILFRYKKTEKKRRNKYRTSTLDPEVARETIPKLIQLIETKKLYLDPDLTLKDLSQTLKIHYNHLSRIINEHFGLSYNDFINIYRIEEAKNRISSKKYSDQNISQIMYDTGFYSKSVFNSAFKKFTGFTPSEYRKKNLS